VNKISGLMSWIIWLIRSSAAGHIKVHVEELKRILMRIIKNGA